MNSIPKYVFSSTLSATEWTNSRMVRGDVAANAKRMKEDEGKNLILCGHGPLGASLLEHGLLDELQFAIHPVFAGEGTRLFREDMRATLELTDVKTHRSGVVVVTYRPAPIPVATSLTSPQEDEELTGNDAIQVTGVATVGIPVRDQERAVEFYVGTLGLEKSLDVPIPSGGRWIALSPRGESGTTLALVMAKDDVPSGVETGVRLTTPDADAAQSHLAGLGVDVGDVLRWPGVPPMFTLRDPDGNRLELIEAP